MYRDKMSPGDIK